MNENSQFYGVPRGTGTSVALGVVLGALMGAGIALLLAPATGEETRRRIADAGRRLGGVARDKFNETRGAASDLNQDAKAALGAGREAFEHSQKSREPSPAVHNEMK